MVLDYHRPGSFASVDALLEEGIKKEAYLESAGWTYAGLISVARPYGFSGESRDIAGASDTAALSALREALQRGPVIVSVYYTFEPGNPIPHLVVVSSIDGDTVRYNDPAEPSGNGSMSLERFMKAWKKRYIEIYPVS